MTYLTSSTAERRGGLRSCLGVSFGIAVVVVPWFVGCYQLWEWIT